MREQLIKRYYTLLEKSLRPLLKSGVSPNAISLLSLLASLSAGICYGYGRIFSGGLLLLLAGFLDTVDGSVARLTGRSDRFGALLDSTLDRYAEFFVFFGFLYHFRNRWMFAVVLLALMGSVMVSYVKARAQSLGTVRTVGLMQRPERFALLIAGSIFNGPSAILFPRCPDAALSGSLILLALLSNGTALHRLLAGRKDLAPPSPDGDPP
jgi:CDP-diacylglycerol--glycerol-3-phosphate 3-phosphatidyltransferase